MTRIAGGVHPAVLALAVECRDKVDQTLVPRALEAQCLHAVAHHEDRPVPHPDAAVELDVEDVPAPILHARHALAVCHARQGQLPAREVTGILSESGAKPFIALR